MASSPATTPKTRQGLSLSERIKVIEARQMGKSMRQLAAQFHCGKTQILNTLAQKERYLHEWHLLGGCNNPSMGARKRFRHTRNEQINSSVHEWYHQQKSLGVRITGPMLQHQARHTATQLGIANFAASNGWLANFRRFYNILAARSWNPVKTKIYDGKVATNEQMASTSNFEDSEELAPIVYEEANRSSSSPLLGILRSHETDPLEDTNQNCESGHLIYLPVSTGTMENGEASNPFPSVIKTTGISPALSQTSCQQSPDSVSLGKQALPNQNPPTSTLTSNHHRKRRLLQVVRSPPPLISADSVCEMNTENLVRKMSSEALPLKDCLSELTDMARSKGLVCVQMKDGHGNDWLEIRQFVTSHFVPKHNYPIHLSRLIVDSSIHYFLEVLGHCVRQGSLIQDTGNGVDYSKAAAVLRAIDGGFTVCAGVDPDSFNRLSANGGEDAETVHQICYAEKLQLTLPDNRYRSSECSKWIDNRIGPRCSACLLKRSFKEELIPIDLRCTSSNNEQYE